MGRLLSPFILLVIVSLIGPIERASACPDINGLADMNCDGRLRIVCFGDSITKGEQDSQRLGYPGRLRTTFYTSGNVDIFNIGIGGETTNRGRSRAGREFSRYANADYAIILEGVNDFFQDGHSSSDTRSNLLSIVRSAKNAGAITLLASLTDVRRANQHPWVVSVNSRIRSDRQIDFYSLGTSIISGDKLHPNGNGYQRMAQVAAASLSIQSSGNRPVDSDDDGIYDFAESRFGTDPNVADTDGDGLTDGVEVFTAKTSPIIGDTDGDGVSDAEEFNVRHTDPNSALPVAPSITSLTPVAAP